MESNLGLKENEIDLLDLWNIVWESRRLVVYVVAVVTLMSIVYAYWQVNLYRAEVVLTPAEVRQSGSPLTGQLGAAASLVGITVGEGAASPVGNAIAILESREFIRKFIAKHDLLVSLMASNWSRIAGEMVVDSDIYDIEAQAWVSGSPPTDFTAYQVFSQIFNVVQDTQTGLIRVTVTWPDPRQAQQWANWLVADINEHVKERDLAEARNSIEFLQKQMQTTQLIEMQRVFYQLIESQTRITMLADVRDEYVFQVIDPAIVPEQRVSPNRGVIMIVGVVLGLIFGVMAAFAQYFLTKEKH